ncbi:MAG: glycosyltransferase, partial [Chthoniobacterales bacterium]
MTSEPSATHGVIIPSYNSGPLLAEVVRAVAEVWRPVWVVVDGSTDGSERDVLAMEAPGVICLTLRDNVGKGGAVLV